MEGLPPLRVMALRALGYCERLFYLEEVENIHLANLDVYEGRALHAEQTDADAVEWRSFTLQSASLGLTGRVDAVRHRDGGWIPYEHKKGRARRSSNNSPEPWPGDALQVCAYGMMLEEALDCTVEHARIRYHADGVTVRVSLSAENRERVRRAIARAHELAASTRRPPVTDNERLCVRCALAPVCLPEEERLAHNPRWHPVRLFPPYPVGRTVHVSTHDARVSRSGETIVVRIAGKPAGEPIPIRDVESIVVHGYAQVTTQTLGLCARHGVPVHFVTAGGFYVGAFTGGPGTVHRRIRQFEALRDDEFRLKLSRRLVVARIESQIRYLLRATRGRERSEAFQRSLATMRQAVRKASRAEDIDALRGYEGMAGRAYFDRLPDLINPESGSFRPEGRSRRPPKDPFNALLSFGYALLQRCVLEKLLAVGLEPSFGFYHTPRSSAHPLVLDLMELFRLPVWDIALIGAINRRQWDVDRDFNRTRLGVWLNDEGRRKAIEVFERRLRSAWRHPVIGYSLSWARTIELEARLLEKEWTGSPGLFARSRLR